MPLAQLPPDLIPLFLGLELKKVLSKTVHYSTWLPMAESRLTVAAQWQVRVPHAKGGRGGGGRRRLSTRRAGWAGHGPAESAAPRRPTEGRFLVTCEDI